jgi:hypothetical protein
MQTVKVPCLLLPVARTKYPDFGFDKRLRAVLQQSRGYVVRCCSLDA